MMFFALLFLALLSAACKGDPPLAPAAPPKPASPQKEPGPPPPGTDADRKLTAALALARLIDDSLATYTLVEKPLAAKPGKQRKVKVWSLDRKPKKTTLLTLDEAGNTKEATDIYYDDRGKLGFVRTPDSLYVFHEESLALVLDHARRIKRTITPQEAKVQVDAVKEDSAAALAAVGL